MGEWVLVRLLYIAFIYKVHPDKLIHLNHQYSLMRKEYLTLGYQNTRGEGVFYLFHGSKVYFKVYFIGGFLWFLRH